MITNKNNKWAQIGYSWLSMKTWVKVWLIWLNLVLWSAAFFLFDPIAQYTLLSLIPAFGIIVAIAYYYGGLVRLLGIGHLIPWIPLLIYLELRFLTDLVGAKLTYSDRPLFFIWAMLLEVSLGICLLLDVYDLYRWFRGERFVLGTRAAYQAKASKLSRQLATR
ncbi:hypothetical protein Pse7367_1554 [Thalassoporum mexicanum PCC 7367]|uniref:hypothetical protein n=1 Tax=Thalassoporum mexicanum TaxID=3457544 RepID=UPI00029FFBA1|nr:hypothetical protein [Pseudanabaena sp. PCC 7367]AFY69843.1 hypothetical protein Pse7367_1554 [Pseudanabaena sp. PCC 7367]